MKNKKKFLPIYLPQIHKIDQVSLLSYHGHQKAPRSHSHSLPLPQPRKSGTSTRRGRRARPPAASRSRPEPGSCYHQTEHVSTGPWASVQLLNDHHTLNGRGGGERWKSLFSANLCFLFIDAQSHSGCEHFNVASRLIKQAEREVLHSMNRTPSFWVFLYKFSFITRETWT